MREAPVKVAYIWICKQDYVMQLHQVKDDRTKIVLDDLEHFDALVSFGTELSSMYRAYRITAWQNKSSLPHLHHHYL